MPHSNFEHFPSLAEKNTHQLSNNVVTIRPLLQMNDSAQRTDNSLKPARAVVLKTSFAAQNAGFLAKVTLERQRPSIDTKCSSAMSVHSEICIHSGGKAA